MDANIKAEEKGDPSFGDRKPIPTYREAKDIFKTRAIIYRASLITQSELLQDVLRDKAGQIRGIFKTFRHFYMFEENGKSGRGGGIVECHVTSGKASLLTLQLM
jgi:hypothetical protein